MQGQHKPKTIPGGKRKCRRCGLMWEKKNEAVAMSTRCPGRKK